ncbi:MAG: hypothetical protein WCP45_06830 [Verrucomicrobiota bacterium]
MNGFYTDRFVRQRLIEFLGGETLESATAVYVTHSDGCRFDRRELHAPADLDWFFERDLDIARSLADTKSHLLHLDLEYVNFDSPGEVFVDPWRCFELQEPVVKVIEALLLEWGIRPLHIITGQGHHFVWRIARTSKVAQEIQNLGLSPELTDLCMERLPPPLVGGIVAADQTFFAALALVIEFVAHRIKEQAATRCALPVEITAVSVGPHLTQQREMISIDISEYGDPLHTRMIRLPFTNYRKPWVTGLAKWLGIEDQIATFRAIPLHEMDFRQAIKMRQEEQEVLELARRACVRIPRQEAGTHRLLECYRASRLRSLHEFFYSIPHGSRECWVEAYGGTSLDALPPCARHLVVFPNDLLLKPAGLQMLTRCLLAQNWHPRHIAGLIRSKFEDPAYDWGNDWSDYEAATRADFYTRLFAFLHMVGIDRLVDFNCTSNREKGFCFPPQDGTCNLEPLSRTLLTRLDT